LKRRALLVLAAAVFAVTAGCDAATKVVAQAHLSDGPMAVVPGFVELHLVYNTGIAFSGFMGTRPWMLAGVALAAVAIICGWLWTQRVADRELGACALALVAAGGVANAVDRLADGRVTDMIAIWPYPAVFNVADVAVVVGAIAAAAIVGTAGEGRVRGKARIE
jgi:signal peptidase II